MIATKPQPKMRQSDYVICPICHRGKLFYEDGDADDVPIILICPGSKRKAKHHTKCDVCRSQVGFTFKN